MNERENDETGTTRDETMTTETPTEAFDTTPAAAAPATTTWSVAPSAPRRVRVATVVWGMVVVAVAVGLVAAANGAVFDVQLAGIVLVAVAGLALLVGSLAGARRRA